MRCPCLRGQSAMPDSSASIKWLMRSLMLILFRVDSSAIIGRGHVMRCLTLAEALKARGAEVQFLCREYDGDLCGLIEDKGFSFHRFAIQATSADNEENMLARASWPDAEWRQDVEQTLDIIESLEAKPAWLIVDHYAIDHRWEVTLRPYVNRIMVIDDLANRKHNCDLLLDQTFGEGRERYADCLTQPCEGLFGSRYALLRPEFLQCRKEDDVLPDNDSLAVHLFFGSGDQGDFALRFSKLLLKYFPEIKLNVVAMTVSDRCEKAWDQVRENYPGRFRVVENPDSMAKTMSECDVAIGAPGIATWERACVGIPAAYLATAENQVEILRGLESSGLCVFIGRARDISDEGFINAARLFFEGKDKLISMRLRGIHMFDGKGTDRVAAKMVNM